MANQDSRDRSPEKGRDAECTYSSKLAQVIWTGHVTRILEERLPKKILYGELEMSKRSHGGQKKRYKDTLKASLKDFNIPTEAWEQLHRIEQSGEASSEEVLVNMRQKESAKLSRNVHSAEASPTELSCSDLCCSICNRQFRTTIELISHLRTHKL